MTINLANNNPRIEYSVAEGVTQQTFAVPFEFFDDGDLSVYVDGVLKAEGTDYTTTGGDGSTGTVVFVTATPPDVQQVTGATGGSQVVIVRNIPIERTSDFSAGSDINRAALNEQLDILTAMLADLKSKIDRSITLTDYDVVDYQLTIPPTSQRLNKYLAFGSTGELTLTSGTTSTIVVSSFGETLIDDISAVEALQTLGLTATAAELNILDGVTATTAELNILDGVTATAAELNILDGVTATTAEINILDGVTVTATELNYVGGVTSSVQTQLDAKYDSGDLASQAEAQAGTDNTKLMTPLRAAQAIAALGGIAGINVLRFASSGTYTPTAGYRFALCIVVGGGGGGDNSASSATGHVGGAGATTLGVINLSGLAAQTVTVGAGGAGGTALAAPGNGGTSAIGSLVTASGGDAGSSTTGAGASGTTGAGGVVLAAHNGGSPPSGGTMGPSPFFMPSGFIGTTGSNSTAGRGQGGWGRASGADATGGAGGAGYVIIVEFK